jgi:hypothetical protein
MIDSFTCYYLNIQFLAGSLSMSIDELRKIEEISNSPDDLQSKFGYTDECGNRGVLIWMSQAIGLISNCNIVSENDACMRAAEIYQCGQEKDPALVFELQGKLTDNSSATNVHFFSSFYCLHI